MFSFSLRFPSPVFFFFLIGWRLPPICAVAPDPSTLVVRLIVLFVPLVHSVSIRSSRGFSSSGKWILKCRFQRLFRCINVFVRCNCMFCSGYSTLWFSIVRVFEFVFVYFLAQKEVRKFTANILFEFAGRFHHQLIVMSLVI